MDYTGNEQEVDYAMPHVPAGRVKSLKLLSGTQRDGGELPTATAQSGTPEHNKPRDFLLAKPTK